MWARILGRPQFNVFNAVIGIYWRVFIVRAHSLRLDLTSGVGMTELD